MELRAKGNWETYIGSIRKNFYLNLLGLGSFVR